MSQLPLAILAGGMATRLHPITETIPKALVDVAGEPFIFRQLEYLGNQGIQEVVLCTGHLGEMIEEVVGDGSQWELQVRYSADGPTLLGTGGALRQALPMLGDAFFVLYGDSFLPIDFKAVKEAYLKCGKAALMTVMRNGDRWDKSNVIFRDGELLMYDKHSPHSEMEFIDYGLSVMSAKVLAQHPVNHHFDLAELYTGLSKVGNLAGLEIYERFYEIGSHQGLAETEDFFLRTARV